MLGKRDWKRIYTRLVASHLIAYRIRTGGSRTSDRLAQFHQQ
jgi:hypothetical protein